MTKKTSVGAVVRGNDLKGSCREAILNEGKRVEKADLQKTQLQST